MGMFAETANVDYRLSFVDQGKQTPFSILHLQSTNGSVSFPFSLVVYVYIETAAYIYEDIKICIYRYCPG
jgi:hypothetical protein